MRSRFALILLLVFCLAMSLTFNGVLLNMAQGYIGKIKTSSRQKGAGETTYIDGQYLQTMPYEVLPDDTPLSHET
jgi:hypothetical protein